MLAIVSMLLLAMAAPASVEDANRLQLMNEIEKAVILPKHAKPLGDYGQNYAFSGDHQVVAVYFIPERALTEKSGCFHGDLKPCSKDEVRKIVTQNAKRRAGYASAGKRRWFGNEHDLPAIHDGGCFQITIRYDIPSKQVLSVRCNQVW